MLISRKYASNDQYVNILQNSKALQKTNMHKIKYLTTDEQLKVLMKKFCWFLAQISYLYQFCFNIFLNQTEASLIFVLNINIKNLRQKYTRICLPSLCKMFKKIENLLQAKIIQIFTFQLLFQNLIYSLIKNPYLNKIKIK